MHLLEEQIEQNPDEINWEYLSENPNAMHLLEKNQDKIDWSKLCRNHSIFKLDTYVMKRM